MSILNKALLNKIREHFALDWRGVHGAPHWARVRQNGLYLAAFTAARVDVVEAFAFLHDSCRQNDWEDPGHGARAAEFAEDLVKAQLLPLDAAGLALLTQACAGHTGGRNPADPTIATCWDADRLDLGRVGIHPNPRYLCTEKAKEPAVIAWAYARSQR
jgi:uncharacterized protein